MAHLTIKNVGPIKDASFDLNKINVFMGPQSSGKSTIAKIMSYCSWFEKNLILHPSKQPNFFEELIAFHNLEESYFSNNSRICYENEMSRLDFYWGDDKKSKVDILSENGGFFRNRKIMYIPAERNFVTLSGLGKYTETRDNILSFMYEWFLAKKDLSLKNAFSMPVKGLGDVSYYYDKETDTDNISIEENRNIRLNHSSSGLRSSIPMLVVFNYVIESIYRTPRTLTPLEIIDIEGKLNINSSLMESKEELMNKLVRQREYKYSQVIIEEPELNLFPKTQQEVVYYMLSVLNETERDHQLILTTHSPFILFALNNCIMGGIVGKDIPEEEKKQLPSHTAWIDPTKVSIFEIHDGHIRNIQDEDGIIEDNYLNQAYKENSSEYLSMLNYFEDEK
jgi:hypothetical protein